jgi:hypothetical protein
MKNANNSFSSVYVLYSRLRIKYLTVSSDRLDERSLNEVLLRHDILQERPRHNLALQYVSVALYFIEIPTYLNDL